MFSCKTILVPTDFSDYADVALKDALGMAETCSGVVHLVHVVREGNKAFKPNNYYTEQKVLAEAAMKEQIARFEGSLNVSIEPMVLTGHVATTLLKYQKKIKASIVVIATQGQTAFEDYLMGSTARRIMRHATCSVLLVRKPKYPK